MTTPSSKSPASTTHSTPNVLTEKRRRCAVCWSMTKWRGRYSAPPFVVDIPLCTPSCARKFEARNRD